MAQTEKRIPLLDLDELIDRRAVKISGNSYELLNRDELNVLDYSKLAKHWKLIARALSGDATKDDEVTEAARFLDESIRLILRAPADVQATLTDSQRLKIATFFMDLQGDETAAAPPNGEPTNPAPSQTPETEIPTGEK